MIRWRTKLPFCQFVYLCSIAAFLFFEQIRFDKAIYLPLCADRQSSIYLAKQCTRRFCARGDGMPPCCLATGRWGAARPMLDTGIARDPAPCSGPLPPAWSYEESTGWHDENKVIITETPNVTMSWTRMIGHCCTMISLKRVHPCNGHFHFWTKKQCKKWFGLRVGLVLSRVHKLSYAKKTFLCSFNFFCEKFPIKHCSTHNMWIRWFFRSISSSYFHRNIMYIWMFAHPRLTTYQLDWTRMLYKRK